ncbi:MFS transporter [Saccharospirillum mangrovi]|uniref:MFS transporter n=1 Tax=Saccharospirillum mangrovi TaxID=2161747 RepID=UPI0013B4313C|nr:MFS transporter [Saccharospirillum mangrovi]
MAFNSLEKRALFGLGSLYAARMLGLFMVLPVLTLYGQHLAGATTQTLGLALGIYGVTQALLQIPLGMLSDRFGRKPVIFAGLMIFFAGSVLAALADDVVWLIVGRALQGSGAIASVVLALLADYTREEERTKAMAIVGAVIGGSFVLAVMVGPWLAGGFGLAGLFWATAGLALGSLLILAWLPTPPGPVVHKERQWRGSQLGAVLRDRQLTPLSLGIFCLHLTMTALFVGLPVMLTRQGADPSQLGWIYAPVMVLSFVAMAPLIMIAERRRWHVPVLLFAAALVLVATLSLGLNAWLALSVVLIWLFFVGFNLIEASLPSLLSRRAPGDARGTAMGLFSTGQFLGAACGGVLGGWLFGQFGRLGLAALAVVAMGSWMLVLWWAERSARTVTVAD